MVTLSNCSGLTISPLRRVVATGLGRTWYNNSSVRRFSMLNCSVFSSTRLSKLFAYCSMRRSKSSMRFSQKPLSEMRCEENRLKSSMRVGEDNTFHRMFLLHYRANGRTNLRKTRPLVGYVTPTLFHQLNQIGRTITVVNARSKRRRLVGHHTIQNCFDRHKLTDSLVGTATHDNFLQDYRKRVHVALLSGRSTWMRWVLKVFFVFSINSKRVSKSNYRELL